MKKYLFRYSGGELDSLNRAISQIFRDYTSFTRERQTAYLNLLETDSHYNQLRSANSLEEISLLKQIQRLRSDTARQPSLEVKTSSGSVVVKAQYVLVLSKSSPTSILVFLSEK